MRLCMITFRSITPAQRGEALLRRAGLECVLQRTPRWMEEQGCGYSLRLRQKDLHGATLLLRENGVAFRKVYISRENGGLEEVNHGISG